MREVDEPIATLRKIKEKLKDLPCESIDWLKFEKEFAAVHPEFRKLLKSKHPSLTAQEARLCLLLRVGMKSHEAARLMCISERGVESHRANIRRKLGLKGESARGGLTEFLAALR